MNPKKHEHLTATTRVTVVCFCAGATIAMYLVICSATCSASSPLISVEQGGLPIILSAPHGGLAPVPGAQPRKGIGIKSFVARPDVSTDRLTESIADSLEKELGKRPYIVIAKFHRKYVDANRSPERAYESDTAKETYDSYHRELLKASKEVIDRWGYGVLLDIHGQNTRPSTVFRGTNNGRTTNHLVSRFGWQSLTEETSLFGQLSQYGFSVLPAVGSSDREDAKYNGGYIVANYGSRDSGTLDAIQLDIGKDLRIASARQQTADRMAKAIASFARVYLRDGEQDTSQNDASSVANMHLTGVAPVKQQSSKTTWRADFTSGDRNDWFTIDGDSSKLNVTASKGFLENPPELRFTPSAQSSLTAFTTHFPEVRLANFGDTATLRFDAKHNSEGFINRGFRFGLFHSSGTRIESDGNFDTDACSLDDNGYFAVLDLGTSTSVDSAAIRETTNRKDERLWNGSTIAFDKNGDAADPLIFTRGKRTTYTFVLTRNEQGSVDIKLKNNVSGEQGALKGTSQLTPIRAFDTLYFGTKGSTADFAFDNVSVMYSNVERNNGDDGGPDAHIRVGVYVDRGAGPSKNDLLYVLEKLDHVTVERLSAEDIRSGRLAELDLLILPGGSGRGQGRNLGEDGRKIVREFVHTGGGFIGICAGAYVASADYSWSLNILDAKVVDRQHWNRGKGTVEMAMTEFGRQLLKTETHKLPIHYGQGPLLAPAGRLDIDDYEIIATFDTEIADNGAPPGIMKGTTAIAQGRYGKGEVICFSPHPEMTIGLESMLRASLDHVKRKRPE